jgi:hypothetical protein
MTDRGDLRIPVAMRPVAEKVIVLTDAACADLLDEEYAGIARHVVAKLARKRPLPLQSGRAATWAGGVLWALGQVNFLFDRSTEPYVTHDALADAFGLSKSTLGEKAKQIRNMLKMTRATPEFLRAVMIQGPPAISVICRLTARPTARWSQIMMISMKAMVTPAATWHPFTTAGESSRRSAVYAAVGWRRATGPAGRPAR